MGRNDDAMDGFWMRRVSEPILIQFKNTAQDNTGTFTSLSSF